MGYLKGYKNIEKAAGYSRTLPSEEAYNFFLIQLFDLIYTAYGVIRNHEPFDEDPEEPLISVNLFAALEIVVARDGIPFSIVPDSPEYIESILKGKKKSITARRYDIYFQNWDTKDRIEFGIEAKLLVENNFRKRNASHLVNEYVSDAGMGKYINGIYEKRGCMIGYIVEGRLPNIINKINKRIESKHCSDDCLKPNNKIIQTSCKDLYFSNHVSKLNYSLYHIFLPFN